MYIKMVGDTTKYQGKLERMDLHLIKVSGLIQHTSGFRLYLDNDVLVGDYSNFIYPYLDPTLGEGVYEYSDNNMSYDDKDQPSKEEEERQKIEYIIDKKVGKDIESLSQQLIEVSNILAPMYEVIMEIQEALTPTDKEDEPKEDTPSEESEDKPEEVEEVEDNTPKEEPQETLTEVEETETNEDIVEEEVINQTDTIEPTEE
jgi:hypothetical protein